MFKSIQQFIKNNRNLSMALWIGLVIGGVALAYFTNDAEPWGTIGGFIAGISLFLLIATTTIKQ